LETKVGIRERRGVEKGKERKNASKNAKSKKR
jgi:hypothetical protein